jgi:surfeit locus 1 family protein
MTEQGRRVVVLLAALLTAALTARLGFWQLDRASQKTQLQDALVHRQALPPMSSAELAGDGVSAAAQHHRRIVLQGSWLPESTIYLENRQMDARNGFFAVTPLLLDDGTAVLVQRGWFPRDQADRARIVAPPPPLGRVTVTGRIAPGPGRVYEFSGAASGAIRQNLDVEAYAHETALKLRPLSLVQEDGKDNTSPDGLLRHWPLPAADVHKHYGYAFQWFALSALAIVLYAWFQIIRPYRQRSRQR